MIARVRLENWFFSNRKAPYGVAVCRILAGVSVLGLLATNFASRSALAGPGASWAKPDRDMSAFPQLGLVAGHSAASVTAFYVATMLFAVVFILGWHTRLAGLLVLIGHVTLIEQNPMLGDQGDNILRIGLIWLLLTDSSAVWSLDARRRRGPVLPPWFTNGVHNIALCGLIWQIVVIYLSAGLFKLQGELWRDGTALYYPLQLPEYRPIPWLADILVGSSLMLGVATWLAVGIQLLFPPLLLTRVTRRVALVLVVLLHVSIGVLMALPWFSLSMVAYDAVFVSTATYVALDRAIRAAFTRWRWSFVRRGSRRVPAA